MGATYIVKYVTYTYVYKKKWKAEVNEPRDEKEVFFHPRRIETPIRNWYERFEQFDHMKCIFSFSVYVCMCMCLNSRVCIMYIFYKIYTCKIYLYLFFHTLILPKRNTHSITLFSLIIIHFSHYWDILILFSTFSFPLSLSLNIIILSHLTYRRTYSL